MVPTWVCKSDPVINSPIQLEHLLTKISFPAQVLNDSYLDSYYHSVSTLQVYNIFAFLINENMFLGITVLFWKKGMKKYIHDEIWKYIMIE